MGSILIKTADELVKMLLVGRIAGEVLDALRRKVAVGLTTAELDQVGEKLIRANGAEPVFIGYRGYRHATCISRNHEVVHGIPGGRVLRGGDIVGRDGGVKKDR